MGNYFSLLAVFMILMTSMPLPMAAAGLRAGAAKSVITPDIHAGPVFMAGYDQNRVATRVHDDLYARCLALGTGDQILVVCAADLIGLFLDDVVKIRETVKTQAPEVTRVIVASTHDHEGPDTMGLWGPGPLQSGIDEKYMAGFASALPARRWRRRTRCNRRGSNSDATIIPCWRCFSPIAGHRTLRTPTFSS